MDSVFDRFTFVCPEDYEIRGVLDIYVTAWRWHKAPRPNPSPHDDKLVSRFAELTLSPVPKAKDRQGRSDTRAEATANAQTGILGAVTAPCAEPQTTGLLPPPKVLKASRPRRRRRLFSLRIAVELRYSE